MVIIIVQGYFFRNLDNRNVKIKILPEIIGVNIQICENILEIRD